MKTKTEDIPADRKVKPGPTSLDQLRRTKMSKAQLKMLEVVSARINAEIEALEEERANAIDEERFTARIDNLKRAVVGIATAITGME